MANKEKRRGIEEAQMQRILGYSATFRGAKKQQVKEPKKKPTEELYNALKLWDFKPYEIRPLGNYSSKSYNLAKQHKALVRHLYVQYNVPTFLYNIFTGPHDGVGFDWFFCLAQGGSFQKLTKGLFTKKECISFLQAPDTYSVEKAFWFAKLHHLGMSPKAIDALIVRKDFFRNQTIQASNAERLVDYLAFYAKYASDMDEQTFDEVTDYLLAARAQPGFSVRGRTLNSVIALSIAWHRDSLQAKYGSKVSWIGKGLRPWYREEKEIIWEVVELTTNHDLITEGRKQHHCVSSYVSSCMNGHSNIFSLRRFDNFTLREYEKNRITFQMNGNDIVQIRGISNRRASDDELRVIRRFATEQGFGIANSRWI